MSDQRRECHAQGAGGDPASGGHGPARTVRRVRAATVTATTPVPGDLEPLDRPAPQRTRGARLNLPVGAGRATAGTASTPAKQCVVTDRILRPPSFASPRRSPRASPCLTCLDTENALRPGNTPDPGEITRVTAALNAGIPFRDVQDFAGHADPRTTRRYDRSRHNLDRHPTYQMATQLHRTSGPPPE